MLFLFARLFFATILGISAGAIQAQSTDIDPGIATNQTASGQASQEEAPSNKAKPTVQGTATPKVVPNPAVSLRVAPKVQLKGLRVAPKLDRFVPPENQMPAFLEAREMRGEAQNHVSLIGDAAMRRQDAVLRARMIDYNKSTSVLDAQINARLIRDGNVISDQHHL